MPHDQDKKKKKTEHKQWKRYCNKFNRDFKNGPQKNPKGKVIRKSTTYILVYLMV